jgi:hypothetical protein
MAQKLTLVFGAALLLIGVLMALIGQEPHFYAPFSVGLALLGWYILRIKLQVKIFQEWRWPHFALFFICLLVFATIADHFGVSRGWWAYPSYHTFFDWTVQKVFEFAAPMLYLFFFLKIGEQLWQKYASRPAALAASAITIVLPLAIITQLLDSAAHSWVVLHMPVTSAHIGSVSIIFTTLGYWILAFVPYALHAAIGRATMQKAYQKDKPSQVALRPRAKK